MVYSAPVRSLLRMSAYTAWTLLALVVQTPLQLLRLPYRKAFPMLVHRGCAWLIGARVVTRGAPVKGRPVIYVANHNGYADICIIGGLVKAAFVAKAEMANWPIAGWCARLSGCVFVDRQARFALKQVQELKDRLKGGDSLIIFPEGTSSDGNRVLKFRSSLFSAAEIEIDGEPVTVQPVTIAFTRLDGIPIGRHLRPFFAWYGDMDMAGHLWQLCGVGKSTVEVHFHDPVTIADFGSRKALANHCEAVIRAGLSTALTGREQPALLPSGAPARIGPVSGTMPSGAIPGTDLPARA